MDNFMNFSFIVVFLIAMSHLGVYTIRLCLPDKVQKPYKKDSITADPAFGDIEMGHAPSASTAPNLPRAATLLSLGAASEKEHGYKGWGHTPLPRKIDMVCVVVFSVAYIIGTILILLVKIPPS